MTTHLISSRINTQDRSYFGEPVEPAQVSTVDLIDRHGDFRQCGRNTRYTVMFSNQPTRLVFQGPIEPAAPRASMIPNATVIALHPVAQPETIEVRDGDTIVFAGYVWTLREGNRMRGEYPKLTCEGRLEDIIAAAARVNAATAEAAAEFAGDDAWAAAPAGDRYVEDHSGATSDPYLYVISRDGDGETVYTWSVLSHRWMESSFPAATIRNRAAQFSPVAAAE